MYFSYQKRASVQRALDYLFFSELFVNQLFHVRIMKDALTHTSRGKMTFSSSDVSFD